MQGCDLLILMRNDPPFLILAGGRPGLGPGLVSCEEFGRCSRGQGLQAGSVWTVAATVRGSWETGGMWAVGRVPLAPAVSVAPHR